MDFFDAIVGLFFVSLFLRGLFKGQQQQQQQQRPPGERPLPRGLPPPAGAERGGPMALPGGAYQTSTGEVVLPHTVVLEPVAAPGRQDPFADWGAWPGEGSTSEEVLDEAEPAEDTVYSLEPISSEATGLAEWEAGIEAVAVGHGTAGVEQPVVDWTQEHERFHEKYVDAQGAPVAATHGALHLLRDRHALRRAMLLAEVIGPPRSMRPHNPGHDA